MVPFFLVLVPNYLYCIPGPYPDQNAREGVGEGQSFFYKHNYL